MLTRSGIHAVRAMVVLAEAPAQQFCGTQEIAEITGSPRNYLGKILQQLSRYGLVESQKGLGGGFRLARDARQITIYEVVDGLEDISRWSECVLGNDHCTPGQPCAIHSKWSRVRDSYFDLLKNTSVADLAKGGGVPDARTH
jgi:Rrf2 family protein